MKLNVDFELLWARVNQMGAERLNIDVGEVWQDSDFEFDDQLSSSGIEVKLDELELEEGLLSVRGRQVVLYIPDQGSGIDNVLSAPEKGRKFHIADCTTLNEMKKRKRFERYKVTNNMSGEFEVYGNSKFNGVTEGVAALDVCQNCINMLNYKGAENLSKMDRVKVVKSFDFVEFFTTYSSLFKRLPKQNIKEIKKGYSADWDKISSSIRKSVSYSCQHCEVNLSSVKRL